MFHRQTIFWILFPLVSDSIHDTRGSKVKNFGMEENSWRGLVLAWANRLNLTSQPAQQMIDFTDGKFFAEFMAKHLSSWKTKGQTSTETFSELEVREMFSTK